MKKNELRPLNSISEFKAEHALAHELPYWDFMEDCVTLADGSLVMGLNLRGIPIETHEANRINQTTLDIRAFLNSLPDECEISVVQELGAGYGSLLEAHGRQKGANEIANWLTDVRLRALEAEQAEKRLLKPELYLFVYRRFTRKSGAKRLSFFSAPRKFISVKREAHEEALRELHQTADNISALLAAMGVANSRMKSEKLWEVSYRFLNPHRAEKMPPPSPSCAHRTQEFFPAELEKVPALALPSPREQLSFADVICQYDALYYDGLYHRCITLKTLPEFTHAALVSKLSDLPFPHTLHVHVRVPEQSKELSALQAKRRMAHSMSLSRDGRATDLESEAKLNSTEELLRELINTGQKIFYFQCTVLLRAETRDELEMQTQTVLSRMRELNGAEGLAETVGGLKVWKTLLPAGNLTLIRPKRVKTDNLADFLPLYQPFEGFAGEGAKPVCLFRNRSLGLVQYDPFDVRLPNYNTLVTGSSGAGKSFVNNLILFQYVSQNPLLYIIDIGGSYRKLCDLLGGQYIEMIPPHDGEQCRAINPFAIPSGMRHPSPRKLKFLMALLESVFTDSEEDRLSKLDKSLLEESLLQLYAASPSGKSPQMSDFSLLLSESEAPSLRQYAKMLYPWTGERPFGKLLDSTSALDIESNTVVFDLKGLSSYPDLQSVMLLIITDFILGRVETIKDRRKQILMDECWELLKSRGSQNFMEYCVRTLRKTGSGITFITQGLEEIIASPIGPAILSNTATKFILFQRGNLEPTRNILKLNDQEAALISSLRQAKGLYSEAFMVANEARAVVRIQPTPAEYWIATSDAADSALLEKERSEHPDRSLVEHVQNLAARYPFGASGGSR